MIKLKLLLFFLAYTLFGFSQCDSFSTIELAASFGFKGHSVISTNDGGFAIIGEGNFSGVLDNVLVKFDNQFNLEWSKRIGLNGFSNTGDNLLILELDNGQFILAGYRGTITSRNLQWSLLSSTGDVIWTKYLSLLDLPGETAADLMQLNSNEVILVGTVNSFGAGDSDGMVIKFDLNGNILFANAIGTSDNDHLYTVELLPNGNFVCGGELNSDAWLFEMDPNGNLIQSKALSGSVYTYIMDTEVLNGSLYFTGKSANSLFFGSTDLSFNIQLSKTLANGNIVGSEMEYITSTNQFLITAIQGNTFANENGMRVVGMGVDGVVQSIESLGSFPNQRGLIRGQNAVESNNVFHVISWYNSGLDRTVIDRINTCGENDCSNEVLGQTVNSGVNFGLMPVVINPITGFVDIEFSAENVDFSTNESCVEECVVDIELEATLAICSGETIEISPVFTSNNPLDITWLLDNQIVGNDEFYLFSQDEIGNYSVEVQATNSIGAGCTASANVEVIVEAIVAPFLIDPLTTCETTLPFPVELFEYQITDQLGGVVIDSFTQSGIYTATLEGNCNAEQSSFEVELGNIIWPQIESAYYLCQDIDEILFQFEGFQVYLNGIEVSGPLAIDQAGQFSLELIGENNCSEMFEFVVSDEFLNENYFENLPIILEDCNFPILFPSELSDYEWTIDGTIVSGAFESPGTYITQITDVCGVHSYSLEVIQLTFNFPEILSEYILCEGESIIIYSENNWSFVENDVLLASIEISSPGVYNYEIHSANNCSESIEIAVNEATPAILPFQDICIDDFQAFIDFIDQSPEWSFNENLISTLMPGSIIVQNSSECGIQNFELEIVDCECDVWVPNAFTPNSDDKNEVWQPVFSNPPLWFELKLFNRWGENIYTVTSESVQPWIGHHVNNSEYYVQNEVYNWILNYQCTDEVEIETKRGFVVLIR